MGTQSTWGSTTIISRALLHSLCILILGFLQSFAASRPFIDIKHPASSFAETAGATQLKCRKHMGKKDSPDGSEAEKVSKRSRFAAYMKESVTKGALKSKLALEHAVGLGAKPNVVPDGEANIRSASREVRIGWHPVGGVAGKWFAEQTRLGKLITEKVNSYPDPTQHWAVLVGDYAHELWMDEKLDVIYINEKVVDQEWHTFEVGETTFNDQALRQAAEMTIYNMRHARPAYNLITNNCQNFALELLKVISVGKHREFGSTFAIYERATGKGKIKDLFVEENPDEAAMAMAEEGMPKPQRMDTVANAEHVMDVNTTKLDNHHSASW